VMRLQIKKGDFHLRLSAFFGFSRLRLNAKVTPSHIKLWLDALPCPLMFALF